MDDRQNVTVQPLSKKEHPWGKEWTKSDHRDQKASKPIIQGNVGLFADNRIKREVYTGTKRFFGSWRKRSPKSLWKCVWWMTSCSMSLRMISVAKYSIWRQEEDLRESFIRKLCVISPVGRFVPIVLWNTMFGLVLGISKWPLFIHSEILRWLTEVPVQLL